MTTTKKRRLKLFQTSSILFSFNQFVKCWLNLVELNRKGPYLNLEMSKKRDARVKLLFCYSKLIAFLSFSLLSPSSLLELPIAVIQKFCYHGNMTSHFSSLFQLMIWKAPRPHTVIHRVIFCSLRLAAKIFRFSET